MRRAWYMSYGAGPDYPQALDDIVVALMIERKSAVDQLDEFLEVKGVDMVQWGGSDFSMSVGLAGQRGNPDVTAARDRVFKTALAKGVPPRAEVQTSDDAKEFLDMGVRHFSIGTDITILYGWWQENGEELWKTMEDAGVGRVE
jgi:2-keto-3-deoxy-L-rhamnonate aldolase RhmA